MFKHYDSLGARSFYSLADDVKIYKNIDEAVLNKSGQSRIDTVSVLGVLMKNYMLASRTIIDGISKTPWMAQPNIDNSWDYLQLPKHSTEYASSEDISQNLLNKLKNEALTFLDNKRKVGILLSGGMDSRVVAGILNLLKSNGYYNGDIVAISWGKKNTRDTIYAERIAHLFGWDFIHLPISEETLYSNIELTGGLGAEFSPVHLHAMKDVSLLKGLDGIFAGSYGDSIGRGEYSGCKVDKLPPILNKNMNHFSFLLKSAQKDAYLILKRDLVLSRSAFAGRSELSYREIEMQLHYMRRQLNACMNVIDDEIPLYQMFSSKEVFGYIWSLEPKCRNDDIYEKLLTILPGNLLDIPWARTGKRYNTSIKSIEEDKLSNSYHSYGKWLRNDCRDFVIEKINNGNLQGMGIFNEQSLNTWTKKWPKNQSGKADRLDEKMAWLASLSICIEKYDIKAPENTYKHTIEDRVGEKIARAHTYSYQLYNTVKNRYI